MIRCNDSHDSFTDVRDDSAPCVKTWIANTYGTASEATAGCITNDNATVCPMPDGAVPVSSPTALAVLAGLFLLAIWVRSGVSG